MTRRAYSLLLGLLLGAAACYSDDTELSARAQVAVNQRVGASSSNVTVVVHDGVATLTGMTSTDQMHAGVVEAARSVSGIRAVRDEITRPLPPTTSSETRTTGGSVPAPAGGAP
jgi:hypothetical protein